MIVPMTAPTTAPTPAEITKAVTPRPNPTMMEPMGAAMKRIGIMTAMMLPMMAPATVPMMMAPVPITTPRPNPTSAPAEVAGAMERIGPTILRTPITVFLMSLASSGRPICAHICGMRVCRM